MHITEAIVRRYTNKSEKTSERKSGWRWAEWLTWLKERYEKEKNERELHFVWTNRMVSPDNLRIRKRKCHTIKDVPTRIAPYRKCNSTPLIIYTWSFTTFVCLVFTMFARLRFWYSEWRNYSYTIVRRHQWIPSNQTKEQNIIFNNSNTASPSPSQPTKIQLNLIVHDAFKPRATSYEYCSYGVCT